MKEFVLRVIHLLVYAFELLLHKTKRKYEEESAVKDYNTEKGLGECQRQEKSENTEHTT